MILRMGTCGIVRVGKIVKMNQKTVEVADMGNTPFGRTVTRGAYRDDYWQGSGISIL